MKTLSLSDRMKGYEKVTKSFLIPRMPIIIRLDGKSFHTYTKQFKTKDTFYSEALANTMKCVLNYLCNKVQGCVCGYTQSDEINLLLIDYQNLNTNVWFEGNIQKISSVTASMASTYFNYLMSYTVNKNNEQPSLAFCDCRCFNLTKEEVSNYFLWRQQDAIRNSKQALAYCYYSPKQVYKKNTTELVEMLKVDFNVDWNECSEEFKSGLFYFRNSNKFLTLDVNKGRKLIDSLVFIND